MLRLTVIVLCLGVAGVAFAQDASMPDGERISIIGGCHDCHSVGYEAGGKIDPATALTGSPVGFQGPWGTTYAANLRIVAADRSEDEWVEYLKNLETRPPMPWFNVRHFNEEESRALHRYIVSLGEPGDPPPEYVPPGEAPETPFIVFVPQMPGAQTSGATAPVPHHRPGS